MTSAWPLQALSEVAKVGAGNSAPQGEHLFDNGQYPFFRTADAGRIRFGGISTSADYLNQDGIRGLRLYPKGTILFPKSGASTFLNHRVMLDVEGYVSSHLATIVADTTQMHSWFLLYFLATVSAQDLIQDHAYPSLNLPVIGGIGVPVPSLSEQQRIVGILDEAFAGIATAKANAEKNFQNARALFESHLQSVFTQRDNDWVIRKLGELSDQITDGTHNSPPYVETGIPMLDSKHVGDDFSIDDSKPEKFISPATDALLAKRCKPRPGDILISSRGSIGKIAIVREGQDFNIMGNMILIRFPTEISREFAAFYLRSQVGHIESISRGVAQKGLYLNQIRDYELPLPSEAVQRLIGKQLDGISCETQRLESLYQRKLDALDALKQSLLHQAFSGQL